MQVCIHRGAKEIGGNCVEVISGGKRLLIDLGLPLDAKDNDKKYLPDISGLDGSDDSLLAIIISHPHLDHFGLLAHVSSRVPVIMGVNARRILKQVTPFFRSNWSNPSSGLDLKSEIPIKLGPFKITPFLIDHSGFDSYSLMIEADKKRLFYSGDFRIHGRKAKLTEKLIASPPENIDVLLLEGSTFGRLENHKSFPSETDIENKLVDIFKNTLGLTLVHTSSQNIDRIVSTNDPTNQTSRCLSYFTTICAPRSQRVSGLSLRVRPSIVMNLLCLLSALKQTNRLNRIIPKAPFHRFTFSLLMLNPRSLACLL